MMYTPFNNKKTFTYSATVASGVTSTQTHTFSERCLYYFIDMSGNQVNTRIIHKLYKPTTGYSDQLTTDITYANGVLTGGSYRPIGLFLASPTEIFQANSGNYLELGLDNSSGTTAVVSITVVEIAIE